jgi:hypothetical protein
MLTFCYYLQCNLLVTPVKDGILVIPAEAGIQRKGTGFPFARESSCRQVGTKEYENIICLSFQLVWNLSSEGLRTSRNDSF